MTSESGHTNRPSPRYRPDYEFPPYTYVPGKTPHPVSDPRGHMFGRSPEVAVVDPDDLTGSPAFLLGLDLFNYGYYWEAHEVWEAVWIELGRRGPVADMVKGLIKLAAAGVKARERNSQGVERHLLRGCELLRNAETQLPASSARRLPIALIIAQSEPLAAHPQAAVDRVDRNFPPFPFSLILTD